MLACSSEALTRAVGSLASCISLWPVGVRRRIRRSSSPCSTVCNSAILTVFSALPTGSTTAGPGTGFSAVFSAGIVASPSLPPWA